MYKVLQTMQPTLDLLEAEYAADHNVRNAILDTLISILKNHKVKPPVVTPEVK
jgi:hypothetical protein